MLNIQLIYNLSVLVALSVLSGFVDSRYSRKTLNGKILQGLLFGTIAIIGMMYPFKFAEGIIFDGRSIVISLGTLFFGPLSGLIALILAIIYRIYLGGGGVLAGTLVISASFLIGYYFYFLRKNGKFKLNKLNLYLFGVIVSAAMIALLLTLPENLIVDVYKTITITVILVYPLITLVIGKILSDQEENINAINKIKLEESLFRTTLYSIGDAVITTNKKGEVQYVNTVAEKLTGWKELEVKGKPLEEVFNILNEDTRKKVENPVHKILRDGAIVGLANHTILISKNGTEIPITDSGAPIINDNNEILGVVLVFRDQTKEREYQRKIQEDAGRLNRAEIVGKVGHWELHLDNPRIIASVGAQKIYGLKRGQFNYTFIKKFPLPQYRTFLDKTILNLIEKNEPYDVVFKIVAADTGEIKDIHSVAQYDKRKKIIFGVIQDI
ncbi:MAG TPA: PAS domain S-box protein, partial [Ignavibacteria bacterium]|nr:PAS domain S-box protein [Ignavibacteria bacterium]